MRNRAVPAGRYALSAALLDGRLWGLFEIRVTELADQEKVTLTSGTMFIGDEDAGVPLELSGVPVFWIEDSHDEAN